MKLVLLILMFLGLAAAGLMSPSDQNGIVLERQLPDPGKACTSEQERVCIRLLSSQRGALVTFMLSIKAVG
jgi:hypothetical protein